MTNFQDIKIMMLIFKYLSCQGQKLFRQTCIFDLGFRYLQHLKTESRFND